MGTKGKLNATRPVTQWEGFYSLAQVSHLARIPTTTLYYWKAKGILTPSLIVKDGDTEIDYGYSYANLIVAKLMRASSDKKLNLKSLNVTLHHLFERLGPPTRKWADSYVYIVGNRVFAEKRQADEWGVTEATAHGQRVETRLFGERRRSYRNIIHFADFSQLVKKKTRGT